jgi:hypothetical protein
MSQTIEVRQQNLDATDSMAQFESPDSEDVCASYLSRNVADSLGEFASLTISDDAEVTAERQKETANYAVYETAGGAVTGLYISHSVFDEDAESPESIGLEFAESDEETFEEAQAEREEEAADEAEGLLADSGDDEDDSDDEEEVEISDEELELTS